MKVIKPPIETILQDIQIIFINPYHYTYVLQKEDNYIYLYDQLTMEIVGKTKAPLQDTLKMIAFTDNFNHFCTYLEGKSLPNKESPQAQIMIFTLDQDGVIVHHRCYLTRNKAPENLALFSISFLEKQREREAYLVGLGRNRIYVINLKGEVVREMQVKWQGKELSLVKGFAIKQNKWIFIEESTVYFATITYDQYRIEDCLQLGTKITSMFLDASRSQFIAFITELHTVIILARTHDKWRLAHKFQVPNLNVRKLCFFYPSVSTSTANHFKDKLFLLLYGEVNYMYDERHINLHDFDITAEVDINPPEKFPIPPELLADRTIYIHEYSIVDLFHLGKTVEPRDTFCMRDMGGNIFSIWANQHAENCVRIFNQDMVILNVDLVGLLPGEYVGKEWVNLGFRFEPRSSNVLYEETQGNFEKEKAEYRSITEEELNDWSYSLFPKDVLMRKSIRRLNCLNFD